LHITNIKVKVLFFFFFLTEISNPASWTKILQCGCSSMPLASWYKL